MTLLCLSIAIALSVLLCFVSYVQLLYLESLRLIRREVRSLERFRESISEKIGLDIEHGSLAFSVIKHASLFLIGVFYLCSLVRPGVPHWQSVLEAIAISFLSMLVSSYLIPQWLYRRGDARWLERAVPFAKLDSGAGTTRRCANPRLPIAAQHG